MLTLAGLSHHTAPVDVRERFAAEVQAGRHSLAALLASEHVREAVLLSTCNRTELYAVTDDAVDDETLIGMLPKPPGIDAASLPRFVYIRRGREVVQHLFRVVSSLDSMILGEPQIQGQVRSAYESAAKLQRERRLVGPVLSRLFESALRVGSRVRSETRLGDGAASIPSAAVELAKKIFGALHNRHAVIIGSGEMSEIAFDCMKQEGARISVVSRSEESARRLAARGGAAAHTLPALQELLAAADIIIAATSAPHNVITAAMVRQVLPKGPKQPLLIVDIALPRDVETEVGEIPNVFLYNLDDLHQVIEGTMERRRAEVPFAESIIAQGVEEFQAWHNSLEVVPLIRELRQRSERIRAAETERALRSLRHLSESDRAAVEVLTKQLLAKLLHQPTVRLREAVAAGDGAEIVNAARYLFELESQSEKNGG